LTWESLLKSYAREVLEVFNEVIQDYEAESLLLSGGLDTSIIACLASRYLEPKALTVGLKGCEAPDLCYAELVAGHLGLSHEVKLFSIEEAREAAVYVVKTLRSFDPMEVRNDISLFIAMRRLREEGMESVITGDGGDELFAGYTFLFKLAPRQVDRWIRDIVGRWFFASKPLGESVGLRVLQPFTDHRVVDLALRIPAEFKIAQHGGITYGKYVLRKAFENLLPAEVVWRDKHPIELGSGSIRLSKIFRVTPEEYTELSRMVPRISQEQAYYLKIFLETFGGIPKPRKGEKACPRCGGGIPQDEKYCRLCGAYPV